MLENAGIKENFGYFELNENAEDDFIKNAAGGFSKSKKPYDIGFFMDVDAGLYIIPFLGTLNEILKTNSLENTENAADCVKYFITSDKVSPNLIIKKGKEFKNFLPLVNKVFSKEFKDVREIISFFKEDWLVQNKFSPTMVLYNSKTFEKIIDYKEETKDEEKPVSIGRNEPCPCGSGKKYKNCCLVKEGK